jgi:hypothetical protein
MLSVTEVELAAVVTSIKDMMYIYHVVKSMGIKVKFPVLV